MQRNGGSPAQRPSYRERLSRRVLRCSADDWDSLCAFRRSLSDIRAIQCASDYFRWQFDDNPYTRGRTPQLWVYKRNGRIRGQQAGIPVLLKVGTQMYQGSWAIDLHVHPEYRLRGIGAVLSEAHIKENDVSMALGTSDVAYRFYRRAGWIDLGTVPLFVRLVEAGEVLGVRWRSRLARVLGLVCNLPFVLIDLCARLVLRWARVRIEEIERFDERVDELWRHAAPHYPVVCERNSTYLNWRFARFPDQGRYRLFYVLRRQAVVGYAVLRLRKRHGVTAGDVVDYLCEPQWTALLFATCVFRLREWGAAAVYCLHGGPGAASALRRLGFVRRDSGARLMAKPGLVSDKALELLYERQNWFVTAGDSDAHLSGQHEARVRNEG